MAQADSAYLQQLSPGDTVCIKFATRSEWQVVERVTDARIHTAQFTFNRRSGLMWGTRHLGFRPRITNHCLNSLETSQRQPVSFRQVRDNTPFPSARYEINVSFAYLEQQLETMALGTAGLVMDPDFQRAHVWTEEQQIAYCEYLFQGGPSARVIYWACEGWQHLLEPGELLLVDGKQRLEAVRKFMRDDLPVFGQTLSQYPDDIRMLRGRDLLFNIADVTRVQALHWYLALNAGGTPHTRQELNKVRNLLTDAECSHG